MSYHAPAGVEDHIEREPRTDDAWSVRVALGHAVFAHSIAPAVEGRAYLKDQVRRQQQPDQPPDREGDSRWHKEIGQRVGQVTGGHVVQWKRRREDIDDKHSEKRHRVHDGSDPCVE